MSMFVGSSFEHPSEQLSSQITSNFIPEIVNNSNTKSTLILRPTPGTKLYVEFPTDGIVRGGVTVASKADPLAPISSRSFAVCGGVLYEVFADKTVTKRGDVSDLTSRISWADAGRYLVFVDGVTMYQYEYSTDILVEVDLTDVASQPTQVIFLNKRIVYINADSTEDPLDGIEKYRRFYFSDLVSQTGVEFNALNFKTFDSSADPIIAIEKRQAELILFGYGTTEIWCGAESPSIFSKAGGSGTSIGIGAKYGITSIQNQVCWLGSGASGANQIFVMVGYTPTVISDVCVSTALAEIDTTDCIAFSYTKDSHVFVGFTFISGDFTKVYDLTTSMWHDRSTRDPIYNIEHRWNPLHMFYSNGSLLGGNATGNQLVEIDLNTYTDYSVANETIPIRRVRQGPVEGDNLQTVFYRKFILDCEVGVGLIAVGEGNDPQIMLKWSDDGGKTFGKERWKSLGKLGEYAKRVIWNRLGRAQNRVWHVAVSAPVYVSLFASKTVRNKSKWD